MRIEPLLGRDRAPEIYTEAYYEGYLNDVVARGAYFKGILRRLNGLARKGRILDVGCGDGLFLHLAEEDGWEVFGVEPSSAAANLAKTKYGVSVFNGFLEEAGFDKGSFDAVTFFNVLGHLEDPFSTTMFSGELLKKDGLLLIEALNFNDIWFRYRMLESAVLGIDELHVPSVTYYFNEKSLRALLDKAGYEMVKFDFVSYGVRGTHFSKQNMPFVKRVYLNYRRFFKTVFALASSLLGKGAHMSVICRKGA